MKDDIWYDMVDNIWYDMVDDIWYDMVIQCGSCYTVLKLLYSVVAVK